MKSRIILLCVLTCLSLSIQSQTLFEDFSIKTNYRAGLGHFSNTIEKKGNSIKMTYAFLDSIGFVALRKESREMKPDINNPTFKELVIKYSHHSKDSVLINILDYKFFDSVLQKVLISTKEELENKQVWRGLDGGFYDIEIKSGDETKIVSAISPTSVSHPLLYRLINEPLNIYKFLKKNDFLEKMNRITW